MREMPVVTTTGMTAEGTAPPRPPRTELLIEVTPTIERDRLVPAITIARKSTPQALEVITIGAVISITALITVATTVMPTTPHPRALTMPPLTIVRTIEGATLVRHVVTTTTIASTTDVTIPIVVVKTIALAYRRA